jgi:TP901 family phage tail tape measure protein
MALGEVFSLKAVIEVITGGAEQKIDSVEKSGRRLGQTFGSSFKGAATSMLAFVGAASAIQAVGNAVNGAVNATITFEKGARQLNTILKLNEKQLADYTESIRTLGTELDINVSATEAMAAAYDVAQAGFTKAADNALVMETALKTSAAAGVSASLAANQISGTLKAYGLAATDAQRVSDVYFKTIETGIITFEQFEHGLGAANAVAASAGVSFEEVMAAVATATGQGIKASTAFDGIKTSIANLSAPLDSQKKAMAEYGIVIDQNTLRQNGYQQTIIDIVKATGGNSSALRNILGDVTAYQLALSLISNEGKIAADNLRDMNNALGAQEAALVEMRKSTSFQLDQMKAAAEGLGIALVSNFGGPATQAIQTVTAALVEMDKFVKSLSKGEGGLLGALTRGFQNTFPATAQMLSELGDTLLELVGMVQNWFAAFGGPEATAATTAVDFLLSSILKLADILANAIGLAGKLLEGVVVWARDLSTVLGATFAVMGQAWAQVVDGMSGIFENFAYVVESVWKGVIDGILGTIKALPDQFRGVFAGIEKDLEKASDSFKAKAPKAGFVDSVSKIVGAPEFVRENLPQTIADARATNARPAPVKAATPEQAKKAQAAISGLFGGVKDFLTTGKLPVAEKAVAAPGAPAAIPALPPPDPAAATKDIEARADAIKNELSLEKISLAEGAKRYQALFKEAQKAKLSGEDLHKVEQALFDVRQKMFDQSEKAMKATEELRVERTKLVQGETAGLLAALDIEKRERAKAGAESVELEAWYGAQRIAIFKADAEKKAETAKKLVDAQNALADSAAKANQDALVASDKPEEAALAGLEQQKAEMMRGLLEQKDAIIKAGGDKLKAEQDYQAAVLANERSYQAQRLKITKDAAKERNQAETSAKVTILKNEAASSDNPEEARKKNLEAENIERLQQIKGQVEAYRTAGVDQLVIDRYIASEQKKIKAEAEGGKADEKGKGNQSPVQSIQEAFAGMNKLGFSIETGTGRVKRRGDAAVTAAANKLSADVGALRGVGAGDKQEPLNDVLTINLVDASGTVFSDSVSRGSSGSVDMSTTYELGRLGA